MKLFISIIVCFVTSSFANPQYNRQPYPALKLRQASSGNSSSLQLDLGYAIYEGYNNGTTGLNLWKGYLCAT